ncbi:sigma-70 family RNA polymerase sigma factor [Saccharopolyspora griseoalba]|uniref:Sigma-70 family RNA polymerase sigma factor n=1 Tax=Saccharopolyspora griseoalba TaxID=1431848 RepID=A0ABW2LE61_9PSEU
MDDSDVLARRFEEHRGRLRAVAFRMLGSSGEAEDAVQEAWLRVARADDEVLNLAGWLTTIVGRVCLDMLRARRARPEQPTDELPESGEGTPSPETEAVMADSVGLALFVVLDALEPAERLAFVLHDMFAVPFDEIAPIVQRSPAASRQLASRARRRVRAADAAAEPDPSRQREVVAAFLGAARDGDFEALLSVLDPDIVLRADAAAVSLSERTRGEHAMRLSPEARGADTVAETFAGRARGAQPALLAGAVGLAWAPRGKPRAVFAVTVRRGRISAIEIIADPEHIAELDPVLLD